MHYWDELSGKPSLGLAQAAGAGDTTLTLTAAGNATAGSYVQIDAEVVRVDAVANGGTQYQVTRGMHSSPAAAHAAQAAIYTLQNKTTIAAFPGDFFGSPYSGSWSQSMALPDVRVASAELFVTNAHGDSPLRSMCLTGQLDRGLRTLSGGQYSIQVDGYLAVESSAAPALLVEASHSVRDAIAVLETPADADVCVRLDMDGAPYCTLTIPVGLLTAAVDGNATGPLRMGAKLTLAVLAVGQTYPGANLTVVIRL
jgi:hypothetical protein